MSIVCASWFSKLLVFRKKKIASYFNFVIIIVSKKNFQVIMMNFWFMFILKQSISAAK